MLDNCCHRFAKIDTAGSGQQWCVVSGKSETEAKAVYSALLVEDDRDLSTIVQANLSHAGYAVDAAFDSAQALAAFSQTEYDLIVMDMLLPDMRGDELCRRIRTVRSCPIIFVSCLDDSATIVKALREGADDYMVKPIDYDELLARAETIIRRARGRRMPDGILRYRQFCIDTDSQTVSRGNEQVELAGIEYELLLYMSQHPGELLSYNQLYREIWGSESLGDFRTIMVHISRMRKKIDPEHRGVIETVRGAGYIFTDV